MQLPERDGDWQEDPSLTVIKRITEIQGYLVSIAGRRFRSYPMA